VAAVTVATVTVVAVRVLIVGKVARCGGKVRAAVSVRCGVGAGVLSIMWVYSQLVF
jgi:hypothetical protein